MYKHSVIVSFAFPEMAKWAKTYLIYGDDYRENRPTFKIMRGEGYSYSYGYYDEYCTHKSLWFKVDDNVDPKKIHDSLLRTLNFVHNVNNRGRNSGNEIFVNKSIHDILFRYYASIEQDGGIKEYWNKTRAKMTEEADEVFKNEDYTILNEILSVRINPSCTVCLKVIYAIENVEETTPILYGEDKT